MMTTAHGSLIVLVVLVLAVGVLAADAGLVPRAGEPHAATMRSTTDRIARDTRGAAHSCRQNTKGMIRFVRFA
jgi:hypothetical protein